MASRATPWACRQRRAPDTRRAGAGRPSAGGGSATRRSRVAGIVQGLVSDVLFSRPFEAAVVRRPRPRRSRTSRRASGSSSARSSGTACPSTTYQAEPVEARRRSLSLAGTGSRTQPLRLARRVRAARPGDEQRAAVGRRRRPAGRCTRRRYAPDVDGLLEAWRQCGKEDDSRGIRSRGWPDAPLLAAAQRLDVAITSDPASVARLVAAAASWSRTGEQPLTPAGDEPHAPELAPPTELIDDMLMAPPPPAMAGAGARRGNGGRPRVADADGAARKQLLSRSSPRQSAESRPSRPRSWHRRREPEARLPPGRAGSWSG